MPANPEAVYRRQETLRIVSTRPTLLEAVTTEPFKGRVTAGMQRARADQAESGFSVVANKETIIFSPLVLGGTFAGDAKERRLGHQAETDTGLYDLLGELSINSINRDETANPELRGHAVLGTFHFHPAFGEFGGFSSIDMETNEGMPEQLSTAQLLPSLGEWHDGVFLTQQRGDRAQTVLFMYKPTTGDPTYQTREFDGMNYQDQQRLLEQSGHKTVVANIPFARGAADLSPAAVALREANQDS